MDTRKYRYTGSNPVHLLHVGIVQPGQEFESVEPIYHPEVEEITEGARPKRKS